MEQKEENLEEGGGLPEEEQNMEDVDIENIGEEEFLQLIPVLKNQEPA